MAAADVHLGTKNCDHQMERYFHKRRRRRNNVENLATTMIVLDENNDLHSQQIYTDGILSDGTMIAVKQLSSRCRQGSREFVNEIGIISAVQHPNLVKLHGCCMEDNQLLLVYEYLENNSLANALFVEGEGRLNLNWRTRHKICIGIARGLAYLHEESRIKIINRDIKASNILLDKNLRPKIFDFGLARLHDEERSNISTRIAGTLGYMAPEYMEGGYLTDKADVYSFGMVALEIVCGKKNGNYLREYGVSLRESALSLRDSGKLIELVDPRLGSAFDKKQALDMAKVALLCTNVSPSNERPLMSSVVRMLQGRTVIQEVVSITEGEESNIQALRDHYQQGLSDSESLSMLANATSTSQY